MIRLLKLQLTLFLFFLFFSGNVIAQTCLTTDSLELLKIYNACGGENWTISWDATTPVKSWYGVKLTSVGNVDSLMLGIYNGQQGNKLTGSFPNIALPALRYLDLSGNLLEAVADFDNLPSLRRLKMANNQLLNLPAFLALATTVRIDVKNNHLDFMDREKLNHFSYTAIFFPQKTMKLELSSPTTLTAMVSASPKHKFTWYKGGVLLSENSAKGSMVLYTPGNYSYTLTHADFPSSIAFYSEIVYVDPPLLHCNSLLQDSLELLRIYDSCGGDNWHFTWDKGAPLSTWQGVSLTDDRCGVDSLSLSVAQYFGGNNLTGSFPNIQLPHLLLLDLEGNQLTSVANFDGLPNLQHLNLRGNNLTGSFPNIQLPSLLLLDLDGNQLTSVANFDGLPNLQRLNLGDNRLSEMPDFSLASSLYHLELDHNQFDFYDRLSLPSKYLLFFVPQDSIPLVAPNDSTLLFAVGGSNYTWYKNGEIIPNIVGDRLRTTGPGSYRCKAMHSSFSSYRLASKTLTIAGYIEGAEAICVGYSNPQLENYTANFPALIDSNSINWEIIPADALSNGQMSSNGATLSIDFSTASHYSEVLIKASAPTANGLVTLELPVILDQTCVWPGDVNLDGQLSTALWIDDIVAFYLAKKEVDSLNGSAAVLLPQERPLGMAQQAYDWLPQSCPDWQVEVNNALLPASYTINESTYNIKYADCNGDGALNNDSNWLPFTGNAFENVVAPSDCDFIAHTAFNRSKHNGNSPALKKSSLLNLIEVGDTLANGDVHMYTVTFGDSINKAESVSQVAFLLEGKWTAELESFYLDMGESHLTKEEQNITNYVHRTANSQGVQDSLLWLIALRSNNQLSPVSFAGEELCKVICRITVVGVVGNEKGEAKNFQDFQLATNLSVPLVGYESNEILYYSGGNTVLRNTAVYIAPKVLLEGACINPASSNFDSMTPMHDVLRKQKLIPASEPYSRLGYSFPQPAMGGLRLADSAAVLSVTGAGAIVDWVLVEVRAVADSSLLAVRPALLTRAGNVVDVDGISPLPFSIAQGDYFIVLKHRNHLPIMTSSPVSLNQSLTIVDFKSEAGSQRNMDSLKVMKSGDLDASADINGADKKRWSTLNGSSHIYHIGDLNMDGDINGQDASFFSKNNGLNSALPR